MPALILLVIFGLGTAYFATQNTGNVHVLFGNYLISGVPIYVVVIISILFGVFISWLISLVDSFSAFNTIHSKDSEIRKAQKTIEVLQEEKHNLEIENIRLKGEGRVTEHIVEDEKERAKSYKPSFFQNLRHSFG
jgi:uncharacterized membrane protein (DUF106 family)